MATAVSIAFRRAGKVYDFDAAGIEFAVGDLAVVKTTRGIEVGEVVAVREAKENESLKKVIRKVNEDDLASLEGSRQKEQAARKTAARRIRGRGLDMKLVDVEYIFDATKAVFYFTAEERVDFRDLVKELSEELGIKVEMRQIGARDEAKLIGGFGLCGERLCCARFTSDFEPVSIRMAKEQDLPLNPQKISGVCGRLMCCLRYEYEAYKAFKKRAPKRGCIIETREGAAKVVDFQVPKGHVRLRLEEGGAPVLLPLEEIESAAAEGRVPGRSEERAERRLGQAPRERQSETAPRDEGRASRREGEERMRSGRRGRRRRRDTSRRLSSREWDERSTQASP